MNALLLHDLRFAKQRVCVCGVCVCVCVYICVYVCMNERTNLVPKWIVAEEF